MSDNCITLFDHLGMADRNGEENEDQTEQRRPTRNRKSLEYLKYYV